MSVAMSADAYALPALGRDVIKLQRRIKKLERMVRSRDDLLQESFDAMRWEMDKLWTAVQTTHARTTRAPSASPSTFPGSLDDQALGKVIEQLLTDLPFRQGMLRLVLTDLDRARFVTMPEMERLLLSQTHPTADVTPTDLSGITTRVSILENEMFKPEGLIPLLQNRVKYLEERRANKAVERGNRIFKDQRSVEAFVITFGDQDIYRYCVDFVSLLMLAHDPFFTVSEGMASEAAAVKANYNLLLEARIALSYQITYPENIMRRSDKKEAAPTDGWTWSST